jgi:hypothetical protein
MEMWQIHANVLKHGDYLITKWSRVLIEKLIVSHLLKKFLTFYGTRRSITVFATACNWSLP